MSRSIHYPCLAGILVLLVSSILGGVAQAQNAQDSTNTVREYSYAIPEMPALTLIDAGSSRIARPVVARALATELVNSIDSAGRVKQGLALAITPWAIMGKNVSLEDYQKKPGKYILANAQVSLGTVRVADKAAATDLGLGLRLTLFDHSDPMHSPIFTDGVRAILLNSLPETNPGDTTNVRQAIALRTRQMTSAQLRANAALQLVNTATGQARKKAVVALKALTDQAADSAKALAQAQAVYSKLVLTVAREAEAGKWAEKKINATRKSWKEKNWNRGSLAVAGAVGWRLNESMLAPAPDNRLLGTSAWLTGAVPLGTLGAPLGQLLGQLRYTYQRQAPTAERLTPTDHLWQYGARLVLGSANVNGYAEFIGSTHSYDVPGVGRKQGDWTGGIEFRTLEGMWVSTGIGNRLSDDTDSKTPVLLFAGLRWQVANGAQFAPRPIK